MSSEFVCLIDSLFVHDHPVVVRSNGGSMRPTIPPNAVVRLEAVDSAKIHLGDVILYAVDDEVTVMHRVVRRLQVNDKRYIQTWGDNVLHPDSPVPLTAVKARVTAYQYNEDWISITNSPIILLRWVFFRCTFYYLRKKISRFLSKSSLG